jgi:hypothetical protein
MRGKIVNGPPFVVGLSSSFARVSSLPVVSLKLKSVLKKKEYFDFKENKSYKNLHSLLMCCYFHPFLLDIVYGIHVMSVLISFLLSMDDVNLLRGLYVQRDPILKKLYIYLKERVCENKLKTSTNKINKIIISCSKNLS